MPTPTPTPTATPTPPPTPTPQCSPVSFTESGSYPGKKLSMAEPTPSDATIFYTTANNVSPSDPTHNGSTATGSTLVYSGQINVPAGHDQFYRAIAYKSGYGDSVVNETDVDNTSSGGGQAPVRMSSSSSTVTVFSVWDGDWAILEEYDANGNRVEGYVQGYHGLVKTLVTNIYYHQDELGSTSHIANASGALLEYYKYNLYGAPRYFDAAGSELQASSYSVVDLGNGGARWIPQLGLYDDRNRFMSPDLGRFLQPDPIGFKGDASNLYRYCGNDWANKTDLLGLDSLNLFIPGSDYSKNADMLGRKTNEVTVAAHMEVDLKTGAIVGIADGRSGHYVIITDKQLANSIKKEAPDYDAKKPVRLNICESGKGDDSHA